MAELQKSSLSFDGETEEENSFAGIGPSFSSAMASLLSYDLSSRGYDVFINYRGFDTRNSIGSVLFHYIQHLGLRVFMASPQVLLGNLFSLEIEQAVRTTPVHIAIFSQNYAYSPWCLAELVLMSQTKAKIVPIFYSVCPSDLRYINKGIYADAFHKYEKEGKHIDKLHQWKEALKKVSYISGIEFKTDDDLGILCKNVVDTVIMELKKAKDSYKLQVAEYPVGLDESVEELESVISEDLQHNNTMKGNIIGIVGCQGVGKTTLVKELYNRKHPLFCRSSFLSDISQANADKTMANLQKKLVCDLRFAVQLSTASFTSSHVKGCLGADVIKSQLESWYSEPFIVLDGINEMGQLETLAVNDFLKYGALVIVTSRDVNLLQSFGISKIYEVKLLETKNARELFCLYAFGQPYPVNGFENIVKDFVEASAGLPSTLKMLGQHVCSIRNGIH